MRQNRKNIIIDTKKLAEFLQVEVVSTNARSGEGLKKLQEAISNVALRKEKPDTCIIRYEESLETHITKAIEILENTKIEFLKKRWLALRILDRDQSLTKNWKIISRQINQTNWKYFPNNYLTNL